MTLTIAPWVWPFLVYVALAVAVQTAELCMAFGRWLRERDKGGPWSLQ